MSDQPTRFLTRGESRKRKDGEVSLVSNPTTSFNGQQTVPSDNKLLAGYLAYEFLTKGTLFGQIFKPDRDAAEPLLTSGSTKPKRLRLGESSVKAEPSWRVKPDKESYAEVASLLKNDGAHIGGLVNPTQLARWIQM